MARESWTSPRVAEELGIHRGQVWRIPRDELPYETSPGGMENTGRRRYRPEDVERYRLKKVTVLSLEDRVAELERLLAEHLRDHR